MEMSSEFDRLLFFEHARRTAEACYAINPLDADNLTKWGGVLLELSQFQNGPDSKKMVQDAVDKLKEAIVIEPTKHDALWCLGNAYTSNAFLNPDHDEAKDDFETATQYYEHACELDPENELYQKSLEAVAKAPEFHTEIHKHGLVQQPLGQDASSSSSAKQQQNAKKNKDSDFKYDVGGWIILALGITVWLGFAKSNLPQPPSPI